MFPDSAFVAFDVEWPLDDTLVEGTIVRPEGDAPFPGVVFIAGSGPTDRDRCTPLLPGTNGSARLLAETLARAGFASIRYDKRASGPRAPENMPKLVGKLSMQSHLDELAGAVHALASHPWVRRDAIFAVGNSEGTLHAMRYAIEHHDTTHDATHDVPLAGVVLIAPPGRSVGVVARSQLAAQLTAVPNGGDLMARYDEAAARYAAGEPANADPSLPPGMQGLLQALETPANLPFARELWTTDGAALLPNVDVPVLVVIGKKDIQVDWRFDGDPLQQAVVGRDNVDFIFPENANHVLKHEPKARTELDAAAVAAYNAADAVLDQEATDAIVRWLVARGRRGEVAGG